jgi:hypothetical protein
MDELTTKRLIVAVHDGTDQLACVHLATSESEADEVMRAVSSYGPVWSFPWDDDDPVQWWCALVARQ